MESDSRASSVGAGFLSSRFGADNSWIKLL